MSSAGKHAWHGTAARAEPKLPVPDAEGVPVMAESLGQTKKWLQGTAPPTPA